MMDANIINKYSNKSYSALHRTAKRWFHKFIKLRDTDDNGYGNCIATGQKLMYGTEMAQAGHYFAAGKYKSLEFNEDNVHLQSKQDNYYGHDFAAYSVNLIEKIGFDRFEKLNQLSLISKREAFKEDRFLMIDIIEKYKAKVKELAKEKMFKV
jgi:hypothetical protein